MQRILILVSIFLLVGGMSFGQGLGDLQLIGNKTGLSSVSKKQIREIFRGGQSIWKTGEQVLLVMPSAKSDFALQFSETVLQMSYPALQKFWLALVFQGRANAPVFLNSSQEILEFVKRNPGALAFVKLPAREINPAFLIAVED